MRVIRFKTACLNTIMFVKLSSLKGGGSALRQCFAARQGFFPFNIAPLYPGLKGGARGEQTGQRQHYAKESF